MVNNIAMLNNIDNNRWWNIHHYGAKRQPNGSYIIASGTIHWYNDKGEYHRDNGPAITRPLGRSSWYLNGKRYPFNEWLTRTPISDEQKLLLRLQYD
jgi:hypothetical protein